MLLSWCEVSHKDAQMCKGDKCAWMRTEPFGFNPQFNALLGKDKGSSKLVALTYDLQTD